MSELRDKTLQGLLWSSIDTYGVFIIKLGFSIAIARLLSPEDYGLIGMIAIFIAFGSMFSDGGFGDALVQKKEPTEQDYSSVFYYQMATALIYYMILTISADAISNFFDEPRVVPIIKIMGLTSVISALGSIHVIYFIKHMEFKSYAKISTVSSILSGITGLSSAYFGLGVWALVLQTLSGSIFNTALFWITNKWKPKRRFNFSSMKELFSFGWKMFVQRIMNTVFSNIYYPIIGKYFDVNVLGYYTRARKFQEIAVLQTQTAFSKVLFPAFSSIQDNKSRFSKSAITSFRLLSLFIFPLITILIVTSEPFVVFFLTNKWILLVPYMQLLYLQGFTVPFILFNNNVVNALGYSDITLKLGILGKVLIIIALSGAYFFGIFGLIIGQLISTVFIYVITARICGKKIDFEIKKQLQVLLPLMGISIVGLILGFMIQLLFTMNPFLMMVLQTSIVLISYYALARGLELKSYVEFKSLLLEHIPERYKFLL